MPEVQKLSGIPILFIHICQTWSLSGWTQTMQGITLFWKNCRTSQKSSKVRM